MKAHAVTIIISSGTLNATCCMQRSDKRTSDQMRRLKYRHINIVILLVFLLRLLYRENKTHVARNSNSRNVYKWRRNKNEISHSKYGWFWLGEKTWYDASNRNVSLLQKLKLTIVDDGYFWLYILEHLYSYNFHDIIIY